MSKKKIPSLKLPSFDDKNAKKEAEHIANEDLEKQAKTNEHFRKEKFRHHFMVASIIIFWLIVVAFSVSGIFWAFHLLTPYKYHFLTQDQIEKIQTFLFSAVVMKVGQYTFNKYLN